MAKRALAARPVTDSAHSRYLGSSRPSLIRHSGFALTLTLARSRVAGRPSISALEPELTVHRGPRRGLGGDDTLTHCGAGGTARQFRAPRE